MHFIYANTVKTGYCKKDAVVGQIKSIEINALTPANGLKSKGGKTIIKKQIKKVKK